MFGKVGEGIHSYRIANVAILDVAFTFILAYFIRLFFFSKYNYFYTCIALFLLGIVLHRIFCVRTTVDKILFP